MQSTYEIMRNPFHPTFDKLPMRLPLFPLANAVVMPGTQLPLNIFEPRYLRMTFDALGTSHMIGMIQPQPDDASGERVFRTGTAGRIVQFTETNDGRLLSVLNGICRFDIREELPAIGGYRQIIADWDRFKADYDEKSMLPSGRTSALSILKPYLARKGIETDWAKLEALDLVTLVNLLVNQLPFGVRERQSLVEAATLEERLAMLKALIEVDSAQSSSTSVTKH